MKASILAVSKRHNADTYTAKHIERRAGLIITAQRGIDAGLGVVLRVEQVVDAKS